MSTNLKKSKFTALITYVIVLACMIAALFIPVFDNGTMLIKELPSAFSIVTGISFSLPSFFTSFGLESYYITFNTHLNLAAIAVVAYAVVVVLGIIALIFVAAGKKKAKWVRVIVYIVEILGMLSLLLFAYDRLTWIAYGQFDALKADGQTGWILLAVLGVIWLMFTVQSIYYKKGSGFAKSLLFILSLVGLCCIFMSDAAFSIGFVNTVADAINASLYFVDTSVGFTLINGLTDTFNMGITYIFAFVTVALVIVNVVIDALAISVNSNKGSKWFNIIRYAAELVLAIITAICALINSLTPGIYLYALMVVALLQIVVSIVRMFTHAADEEEAEEDDEEEAEEEEVEYETEEDDAEAENEVHEEIAYDEEEPADKEPAPAGTSYAASPLTDGYYEAAGSSDTPLPTFTRAYKHQDDPFLNSLTPGERAEFYAIFIDKRRGNYYFLPDYEIGGDNKEFFQSLFIYLGKFMGSLSDGLMNKIYRRLNILD